jgi:hypothetical protein
MAADAIQLEIRAAIERFQFEEAGLRHLLTSDVAKDLVRRGIRVQNRAKELARTPPPSLPGQPPSVRTGRLRGSITWRLGQDGLSPYVDVGSAVVYAAYVELGTRRMAARPYLRPALEAARATF